MVEIVGYEILSSTVISIIGKKYNYNGSCIISNRERLI